MKTFAPILIALATACGGMHTDNVKRNALSKEADAQCSISLAHANADAIQRAVQAASDGTLDVCAGALSRPELYEAELASIDETPDGYATLVFWMRLVHPQNAPTYRR